MTLIDKTKRDVVDSIVSDTIEFMNTYCHCTVTTLSGSVISIKLTENNETIARLSLKKDYVNCEVILKDINSKKTLLLVPNEEIAMRKAIAKYANDVRVCAGVQCNDWDNILTTFINNIDNGTTN